MSSSAVGAARLTDKTNHFPALSRAFAPEHRKNTITDKEINLRAGLAAFSDVDCVVAVNLDQFDPLNSRGDLIKLLVETGISFSRPGDGVIAAEDGSTHVDIIIKRDDVVSAAARAACELAASWIDDSDLQAWRVATGRFSR
ncbi:hypothetical protein [Caballeronia sp. ATUFL_F1_KS39]|uniref:hypothetical protein n=1 Tax=Caballeronia sp. ATUFL_F1_KS39 TaxID=2921766 RepID=UPI0020288295|nr:hypothetical protein [Caballeronia sp. ATUFL_F1_KS39]